MTSYGLKAGINMDEKHLQVKGERRSPVRKERNGNEIEGGLFIIGKKFCFLGLVATKTKCRCLISLYGTAQRR
jgi:hypothetical protein